MFSLNMFFFFNDTPTTEIYTLSLHDALPIFMPPNLGGFFMVRSYYPSECHADYFDFERNIQKGNKNRSEERFSRNAETDLVCRLLLEKKKKHIHTQDSAP